MSGVKTTITVRMSEAEYDLYRQAKSKQPVYVSPLEASPPINGAGPTVLTRHTSGEYDYTGSDRSNPWYRVLQTCRDVGMTVPSGVSHIDAVLNFIVRPGMKDESDRLWSALVAITGKLDALDENGCQDTTCCEINRDMRQIIKQVTA